PMYPAALSYSNVISVAATDSGGGLAGFSNWGATSVDVGAPGSGILSTMPGGGYGYKSGTSMATPHVAGEVGLNLTQRTTWTPAQLVAQVVNNTTPVSSLAGRTVSGGIINAAAATLTGPHVQVQDGGVTVPGSGTDAFGPVLTGSTARHTFTVRNVGT